ncbi:ABC transporter ATP-binding protein [Roseicella aquatilis]|uniref:ATP-binding cassette domain-containing protein n=1 Tax=Roseicella aquatilis TaxID=2527868 RepID=A0A4R4DUB7_9PROT|nr:ATP-binding cassette domain-containing protein [Roseicella aquatilis]TCZ65475.1 ATP-binding cassette domain-containing protein [Roseicella aquatilis]
MSDVVLEARDLVVAYGGNLALDLPHLALRPGELVGVVGANGAGKSTLVNALLGWSRGTPRISGSVRLAGEEIGALPTHERVRRGLLLVPEGGPVFGRLTVAENLAAAEAAAGRRGYTEAEVFDLFPRLRERLHHAGAALSGGERQMLAIARSLRLGPRALLLDEPSIGLAPRLVSTVLRTVRRLVDAGLPVLLVEQNVRAAIEVVDRLVLLERGRILAEGPVAAMRDDPRIIEAYLGDTVA